MANELVTYEAGQAVAKMLSNGNYSVQLPFGGPKITLVRDVHFGVIKDKNGKPLAKPSLYKPGAEAICLSSGLVPHVNMESKTEEWQKNEKGESVFFGLYTMKCELHKIGTNGVDYVISSGYGSANTFEKRNGWNSGKPDAINGAIKMAQKRAMVGTVLSISGLSSMFFQDVEDEDFMSKAGDMVQGDEDFVKKDKVLNLMALASVNGFTRQETMKALADNGFLNGKAVEIKVKDYDRARALFEKTE